MRAYAACLCGGGCCAGVHQTPVCYYEKNSAQSQLSIVCTRLRLVAVCPVSTCLACKQLLGHLVTENDTEIAPCESILDGLPGFCSCWRFTRSLTRSLRHLLSQSSDEGDGVMTFTMEQGAGTGPGHRARKQLNQSMPNGRLIQRNSTTCWCGLILLVVVVICSWDLLR